MADRPHILVVMVDQLAASFLRAYGHPVTKTPTFDRLADGSVVFENAYSPSPLCAPARAAFMTGALPSRTAVYDNAAELRSSIPTFAHYLRLEGYRTCLCGKMHFVGADQLHGFEERLTTDVYPGDFGWTPDWSKPDDRIDWWFHNTSSITQAGVADITNALEYDDEVAFHAVRRVYDYARYDGEAPLLLCVSFSHPHDPYVARQRYWDLYDDDEIDLPVAPGPPDAALDPACEAPLGSVGDGRGGAHCRRRSSSAARVLRGPLLRRRARGRGRRGVRGLRPPRGHGRRADVGPRRLPRASSASSSRCRSASMPPACR